MDYNLKFESFLCRVIVVGWLETDANMEDVRHSGKMSPRYQVICLSETNCLFACNSICLGVGLSFNSVIDLLLPVREDVPVRIDQTIDMDSVPAAV